jgi:DNA polymerase III subunit gamma/tau
MTYYLKYRPQILEDLDQESVRNTLIKIFQGNNIPHAFLFSGPRGTGKTSAARIVAKILNCERLNSPSTKHQSPNTVIEPCNECSQCKAITRGESLDVIELDAASHRGIDDVRQIRDAVKLSPVTAKKKVYIIDEAHMLTTEASNALLKTLEEPPDHVVFILATTNPEKLIETIRSRVTNVFFKKAKTDEILRSLKKISKLEKLKISDTALNLIAARTDGSFRDAVKTLEQIVSELKDLDDKSVEEYLLNSSVFNVGEFLENLSNFSTQKAILMLSHAANEGLAAKEITKTVVNKLREMLLGKIGIGDTTTELFSQSQLIELLELFTEASAKLQYSFIEEVPLEIVVVKWCETQKNRTNINNNSDSSGEITKDKDEFSDGNEPPKKTVIDKKTLNVSSQEAKAAEVVSEKIDENNDSYSTNSEFKEVDNVLWSKILNEIHTDHASTEALLRASKPMGFDGKTLKLAVFYKFHKEHLESNQHRLILEKAIGSMIGYDRIRVICELTDPPEKNVDVLHDENKINKSEVILTEPKVQINNTLTNGNGNDIINLAEKIFSS